MAAVLARVLGWARAHKLLATLIVLFVVGSIGAAVDPPATTAASGDAPAEAKVTSPTPKPTHTELSASPTPEATPSPRPQETLRLALHDALNDNLSQANYYSSIRVLNVKWAIGDNVTDGLTKAGAKFDVANMLEAVQESGVPVRFMSIEGTFPLVDNLGNESDETVVRVSYRRNVIENINFDNFLHDHVYDVAVFATIHPAFQG